MLGIGEDDFFQCGQHEAGIGGPGLTSIAGCQQHARAGVRIGLGRSAGRKADFPGDETNRLQRAINAAGLQAPLPAAVLGIPDGAVIAHGPAVLVVEKANIGQPGVAHERFGEPDVYLRRGIRNRWGGRRSWNAVFTGKSEDGTLGRRRSIGILLRRECQQQYQQGRCGHGI